jgi:exportin-5
MIEGLFRELDSKISSEWSDINRQVIEAGENDNLTDEMKTESILRQLTYSSVSLVAVLLDSRQGMYDLVITTPENSEQAMAFKASSNTR